MSFVIAGAAIGIGTGVTKLVMGANQKRKAKAAQAEAKSKLTTQMNEYMSQEIKNPYANMENTMEDLTVNTQAADFAAQKSEQARADIMQNMSGAAGSSGIAALAQTMANQASQEAQMASASIATQEAANQKAERAEAGNIQELERQGDAQVENLKRDRMMTQIGMTQGELAAENQNVADAQAAMMSGVGDIGSGLGSLGGHASSMMQEGKTFGGKTREEGMGFFGGTS